MLTGFEHGDDLRGSGLFVVLVERHEAGLDAKGVEQALTVTGVFGGHRIHGIQHRQRAQAHVMQITQRRGHHIQ